MLLVVLLVLLCKSGTLPEPTWPTCGLFLHNRHLSALAVLLVGRLEESCWMWQQMYSAAPCASWSIYYLGRATKGIFWITLCLTTTKTLPWEVQDKLEENLTVRGERKHSDMSIKLWSGFAVSCGLPFPHFPRYLTSAVNSVVNIWKDMHTKPSRTYGRIFFLGHRIDR